MATNFWSPGKQKISLLSFILARRLANIFWWRNTLIYKTGKIRSKERIDQFFFERIPFQCQYHSQISKNSKATLATLSLSQWHCLLWEWWEECLKISQPFANLVGKSRQGQWKCVRYLFEIPIWNPRHGQWINHLGALAAATALVCSIYFDIYFTSPR